MQTTFSHHTSAGFWDKRALNYAKKPVKDPGAYEAKLDAISGLLKATDNVLEIGCGTGTTALRLAPMVETYTGTDISPAMIQIAKNKQQPSDPSTLRFAVAQADAATPGGPFDVIMAFSLLHLVEDLDTSLQKIYARLRPGGRFLSKTVCIREGNLAIRGLVRSLSALGVAPPILHLSQKDVLTAITRAGFEIETYRQFGSNNLNPFVVARRPT